MVKRLLITPFQRFVNIESFSGILLFGSALLAILLANSSFGEEFRSLWQYRIGINAPGIELSKPIILWINDGLMAVFFFLIGLEIKRELMIGELNTARKAALPLFAAVGGMLMPVAFFFLINRNPETSHGWGIPMATDIAFSLAIIRILGNRIPLSLKVFLTAFAIIDDLGAVLVIALFYSTGIKFLLVGISLVLVGILFYLAYRKIHAKYLILLFGIIVWYLFLKAGIHPTIAGVLMAFTVPIRQKVDVYTYSRELFRIVENIRTSADNHLPILTGKQIEEIDNLEELTEKVQSPLQQLEHRLHNLVAFLIMPVFALSNSGVQIGGSSQPDFSLGLTILISLVGGKMVGISLFSWLGVKSGIAILPEEVRFPQVIGISLLAGVGFTMSIFIANLAYPDSPGLLDSAKLGVLSGSLIAGLAGYLLLRLTTRNPGHYPPDQH